MNDTEKCEWCNIESLGSIQSYLAVEASLLQRKNNRVFTDFELTFIDIIFDINSERLLGYLV